MTTKRPRTEIASWVAGILSAALAAIAFLSSLWPNPSGNTSPHVSQAASSAGAQVGSVTGNVNVINNPAPPRENISANNGSTVITDNSGGIVIQKLDSTDRVKK